jgi:hypothetical protein
VNPNDFILDESDAKRKKTTGVKIRFLKQGQSFVGRFLTLTFVPYRQHGSFESKIQSHACLDPKHQKACPSCAAGVPSKIKRLVWWYDVEAKEIVVRDITNKSKEDYIDPLVAEYGDDLLTGAYKVAMGDKGALSILPKGVKKGDPPLAETPADVLAMFDGQIDGDALSYVMNVCDENEVRELIAGWKPTTDGDGAPLPPVTQNDPTSGF